jgi:hypothetical protein
MKTTMRSTDARCLCDKLLAAQTEEEVIAVLRDHQLWEDRTVWSAYGGISNNRGIVGNQQSSPVAALVEKIVNSIDAVLVADCRRSGVDPTSSAAPQTMQTAMERFLGIKGGKIQNLDSAARTRIAERIQLVATGSKDKPCYLVVDNGEGQEPKEFPNTFLSLLRDNKTRIPFVQGKYNMGGTGVLQFSGTHSFQLIISRRQQGFPTSAGIEISPLWGFTLIRRLEPATDQPQSTYVYLAPEGSIPSFEAEALNVRPGRYPEAYGEPLRAGTCIKMWNYKLPGRLRTLATLDLRYALERYLQSPGLPIRVCERRTGYRAHSYDTTMSGLCAVLADNPGDIEPGFDTGSPLDVLGVGLVELRIVALREGIDDKRYPAGIFFNVNGQLHSELGADFVSRRTKLDYISDSLVVIVDCTSLPPRVREDLFLASRDRMRHCDERSALEDAIADYLRDHPGLRNLNALRRQSRLKTTSEDETVQVLQELVKADPSLAELFGRGQKVRVPVGPVPTPPDYVGKRFPTYFRIANEPRQGLVKHCPRNRTCRIEFETDATNDYFSRSNDPGHLESHGVPSLMSLHLWNGRAILRFGLPSSCSPGDRIGVEAVVSDVSRVHPLVSSFLVEVEPEALPTSPGPPAPPAGVHLSGFPNIIEVRHEDWSRHGFDEHSAVSLKSGEDDTLDMFINMDNINLRNEVARRRALDPDVLKHWFKYGLALLALGMLYREHARPTGGDDGDGFNPECYERISIACAGLAVTIIPVIALLGEASRKASR